LPESPVLAQQKANGLQPHGDKIEVNRVSNTVQHVVPTGGFRRGITLEPRPHVPIRE